MAVEAAKDRGWRAPFTYPTGTFIRDYLLEHGRASPQEIWRELKRRRKALGLYVCSYDSFWRNYIYVLRRLGLIRRVAVAEPSHPKWFPKVLYEIVPGKENDPRWSHPQIALDERRGGTMYRKMYRKKKRVTKR